MVCPAQKASQGDLSGQGTWRVQGNNRHGPRATQVTRTDSSARFKLRAPWSRSVQPCGWRWWSGRPSASPTEIGHVISRIMSCSVARMHPRVAWSAPGDEERWYIRPMSPCSAALLPPLDRLAAAWSRASPLEPDHIILQMVSPGRYRSWVTITLGRKMSRPSNWSEPGTSDERTRPIVTSN
jgi:hypothetical protein